MSLLDYSASTTRRKSALVIFVMLLLWSAGSLMMRCTVQDKGVLAHLPADAAFPYDYGTRATGRTPSLNSTLGFGKIYILNLPTRTDKRAEMTVLASQYGLEVEFMDGIDSKEAPQNLVPDQQGKWAVAEGHTKIWQHFIQSGYKTALIFEDDVDFDVRIREQLRALQGEWGARL